MYAKLTLAVFLVSACVLVVGVALANAYPYTSQSECASALQGADGNGADGNDQWYLCAPTVTDPNVWIVAAANEAPLGTWAALKTAQGDVRTTSTYEADGLDVLASGTQTDGGNYWIFTASPGWYSDGAGGWFDTPASSTSTYTLTDALTAVTGYFNDNIGSVIAYVVLIFVFFFMLRLGLQALATKPPKSLD